jgi:two-component system OmpR family sensor kinase
VFAQRTDNLMAAAPFQPMPAQQPLSKQRRPWTLRTRLVVALLLLATAGLAVFGVASVLLIRQSMIARVDEQLDELSHRGPGALGLGPPPGDGQIRHNNQGLPTDFAVRVFYPDGTSFSSDNISSTAGPVLPVVNSTTYAQLHQHPFTVDDQSGAASWRVYVTQRPTSQGNVIVAVAQSLDTVEETVSRLVWIEVIVGIVALAALGAIAFLVVRLGLRPLTRIEQTAGSIASGHLDLRVQSDSRTEVGRLGGVLNTMVGRLSSALRQREQSEARLRRFVADASHELRTPLTSIRGFAELNRRGGASERADVDKLMGRIEDEAIRMGLLVEDLLLLARLDQERALDLTDLDLRTLVEDAVHDARARDPDRPVQLDIPETPVRVTADEHRMRQVITNLVNNAVIHTPPGSPVHVRVGKQSTVDTRPPVAVAGALDTRARVVLEVIDAGPGVSLEAAPNIFDRFYRVDSARSRRRGGTGLGLAITAAILEAHGGRVELRTAPGQGARFTVLLPLL